MAAADPAKRNWANVATVTLVVGETKTAFHVHEADLFEASPFFEAAFTSDFRESSERIMTLPEDDDSIFGVFVDWLYRQRYDIPPTPYGSGTDYDRFIQPLKLFVLADKYGVRSLRNLIVSQMFLAFKWDKGSPSLDSMAYVYEHTSQNATIRKFLTNRMALTNNPAWFVEARIQTWLRNHPDISADLIASLAKYILKPANAYGGDLPQIYLEKEQERGK